MLKNKKGFSLIELVVIIAILAAFVVVFAPSLMSMVQETKNDKDTIKFSSIESVFLRAMTEREVRKEIRKQANDNDTIVYFKIDETGTINFNNGQIKFINSSNYEDLRLTKLWLNSYQSIGKNYKVSNSDYKNKFLVYYLTPKESFTVAKCEYKILDKLE